MKLSYFFIERPIFAAVLAIFVMALGLVALLNLPVERYPDIAPPQISITTTYSGASAEAVEQSVTQVLEQQIQGLDNLLYFSSSSDAAGRSRINISFATGTNPDTAQVQVQNSINSVLNRLPEDVQRQGVTVNKSLGDIFLVAALYDQTGKTSSLALSDYLSNNFEEAIGRIEGVGEIDIFGSQYAMRIWLDPLKLRQFNLVPSDVRAAVEAENTQVAAGSIGAQPTQAQQYLNARVSSGARLQTVEQFNNIVLKANNNGALVYLKDVARVEIGAENYDSYTSINGYPSAGMGISLSSGANALQTSAAIKQTLQQLSGQLPAGYKIVYPRDNTPFVQESAKQVVKTLLEAVLLVVVVMFLFLQNFRATLIPTITVPIVILGTFAVLYVFGYSINTLTLFALVLAIGLLVDDAIVVVENVERLMHEQQISAKQAAKQSMQEMTGALVGITLVLTAVFIPMAFFVGSTGVIYRQFSVTLVAAMLLSLLVALVLTPALCGILLKANPKQRRWALWFNQKIERFKQAYVHSVKGMLNLKKTVLLSFVGLLCVFALIYKQLPSSFIPNEDQGLLSIQFKLPDGSPLSETQKVAEQIRAYFEQNESRNVEVILFRYGRNQSGSGQNLGQGFIALKPWSVRSDAKDSAQAIRARAMKQLGQNPNARINVSLPPSVRGLGQSGGLDLWIRDANGQGNAILEQSVKAIAQKAQSIPSLDNLDKQANDDQATLNVKIDQKQARVAGLAQNDINSTLSAAWGGTYINDFIDRGRIKRVIMQGDAPYRAAPENLQDWFVRNNTGQMVPFSQFSQIYWDGGPQTLARYNGLSAVQMQTEVGDGFSSGEAMQQLEQLVQQQGSVDLQWTGLSLQERQSSQQALLLYAVSIAFIFLCLAALYESWSIPSAVLAAIPLGIGGNIVFSYVAGLPNDIYFQIALLTTIGLSCKNAILIVAFAAQAQQAGQTALQAALDAAALRLRPILMTSLAFGAGVLPLVFASGAGALSRQEIGTSVLGGVIFGTVLVLLFIPFTYVLLRSIFPYRVVVKDA